MCYTDELPTIVGAGSSLAIPTSAQALYTRCRPSGPKRDSAFCTVNFAKSVKLASADSVGSMSVSYQTRPAFSHAYPPKADGSQVECMVRDPGVDTDTTVVVLGVHIPAHGCRLWILAK